MRSLAILLVALCYAGAAELEAAAADPARGWYVGQVGQWAVAGEYRGQAADGADKLDGFDPDEGSARRYALTDVRFLRHVASKDAALAEVTRLNDPLRKAETEVKRARKAIERALGEAASKDQLARARKLEAAAGNP